MSGEILLESRHSRRVNFRKHATKHAGNEPQHRYFFHGSRAKLFAPSKQGSDLNRRRESVARRKAAPKIARRIESRWLTNRSFELNHALNEILSIVVVSSDCLDPYSSLSLKITSPLKLWLNLHRPFQCLLSYAH